MGRLSKPKKAGLKELFQNQNSYGGSYINLKRPIPHARIEFPLMEPSGTQSQSDSIENTICVSFTLSRGFPSPLPNPEGV